MRLLAGVLAVAVAGLALVDGPTPRSDAAPLDCAAADVPLSLAQVGVAQRIAATAKDMRIAERGLVIALQTAMQESSLDADVRKGHAVGSFQQIAPGPGNAYASYDRTDPAAAARGFFTVLLARVPGYARDSRANHDIAQVVQASGAGARYYAKWQPLAERLAEPHRGVQCAVPEPKTRVRVVADGVNVPVPGTDSTIVAPTPAAAKAVTTALGWLGTPYSWGGGTGSGPSRGIRDGGVADSFGDYAKVGFDCSGLVLHSYYQAGVPLPRVASAQRAAGGRVVPWPQALPGDLLFWGTGPISAVHHVAIYLGVVDGVPRMVEAPQSGDVVKISPVRTGGDFRPEVVRPAEGAGRDA